MSSRPAKKTAPARAPKTTPPAAPIHPAAAAALMHDGEILLVQRQPHLKAFPGFWSFPGGKVDRDDHVDGEDRSAALMRAMVREVQEEVGCDLTALAADGQLAAMDCIGDATTPPFSPVRFDTHFFRVDLRHRPRLRVEHGELADAQWNTPAEWLRMWEAGRLLCAPPTIAVLKALADNPQADTAPLLGAERVPKGRVGWFDPVGGVRMLMVRSNTIPPAQHTNCFAICDADRAVMVVDPSPANDAEYTCLRDTLADWPVHGIMLTHHHPDHHERANRLASEFGVPMYCSEDTHRRIAQRVGKAWFDGVDVRHLRDGDTLCRWHGEAVKVLAVPGHDAGQLAPMPESRAWCIVSDLIQGVGTVVVGGDEGNMQHYFASLERIIDLDPAVIFPSHGNAMGTTWKLQETLRHRRMREEQVLKLHVAGQDIDGMLQTIYGGSTPDFLMPLARINIESHLEKLRAERRL